jgi:LPS-assembly lipoprotein
MSSSEAALSTQAQSRRVMLAMALSAAALAGGCLQPLYAENTASSIGGSVRNALRDVEIDEIKRLKLTASVTDALEVVTVDFANGRADSAILVARATWSVTNKADGKVVSQGTNMVRAPYERSVQRFATVRAARDAQIRAAKSLATLIRGQLSADLVAL